MRQKYFSLMIAAVTAVVSTAAPVDIMIGSRGYGMGGAYVAIADDMSAAYWNPAGLALVENISLMESNWILQDVEGLNVNYVSFGLPIKHVGTMAVEWLLKHATLEEGRDAESNSANENSFSIALGRSIFSDIGPFEDVNLGLSLNRHVFTTADGQGAGFGFDLAMLTRFRYGFCLGFVARSMGADMMGEQLDPELRFGLGWTRLLNDMHRVTVDFDGSYKRNRGYTDEKTLEPARNNLKYYGGLEYGIVFSDFEIAVRGGGGGKVHSTLGDMNFAFGGGFSYLGYSVQYAFGGTSERDYTLGYGHRISLIIELNRLWKGQTSAASKSAPEADAKPRAKGTEQEGEC
jgi:hypothetical protein